MDLVEAKAGSFELAPRHPWEQARLALAQQLIRRHVDLHPGDTVLDIGCGDTFVAEQLARQHPGVQFYAVDSNFTDQVIATLRARLTVTNVSLFASLDWVPAARPASLILLMDVIEHVPDDVAFLGTICNGPLVREKTRFLITVPAYQALFSSHDRFLGHYRRYSLRTLGELLRKTQLQSVETGYWFASLLPVRILQTIRERLAGPPSTFEGLAGWHGGAATTAAMTRLLTLDGRAALWLARAGIKLPGLSNFALCRKSA